MRFARPKGRREGPRFGSGSRRPESTSTSPRARTFARRTPGGLGASSGRRPSPNAASGARRDERCSSAVLAGLRAAMRMLARGVTTGARVSARGTARWPRVAMTTTREPVVRGETDRSGVCSGFASIGRSRRAVPDDGRHSSPRRSSEPFTRARGGSGARSPNRRRPPQGEPSKRIRECQSGARRARRRKRIPAAQHDVASRSG